MRTQTTSNETIEMYLKTIAELSDGAAPVVIAEVARRLGVTPVSANEMMKRLVDQELLIHERYKGVNLTPAGRQIAHNVIRRQRLWECFLADHLKLNWAGVYEAACRLEHATSNVVAEALSTFLDHPTVCPHGCPIPGLDGQVQLTDGRPLTSLTVGQSGQVERIKPAQIEIYAYLSRHNLFPGRRFTVIEIAPLKGPITLRLHENGGDVTLGAAVADLVITRIDNTDTTTDL